MNDLSHISKLFTPKDIEDIDQSDIRKFLADWGENNLILAESIHATAKMLWWTDELFEGEASHLKDVVLGLVIQADLLKQSTGAAEEYFGSLTLAGEDT